MAALAGPFAGKLMKDPDMPDLPEHADVVVIGGGIVGCSMLYHLAKAGCRSAILLERNEVTSGTTWHSAAVIGVVRGSSTLVTLAQYSADLYASLEEETGQATGWRRNGHIAIAASADRLAALRHAASNARSFGLDVEMIGPSDIAAKWPLLRTGDLHGGLFHAGSGRVNPTDTCQALLKGARSRGAKVFEHTPVEGFEVSRGRVKAVRTPFGTVRCETVVNCTGLWARQVAAMAATTAPLFACEHLYLLTEPIEGVTPDLPTIRDSDAFLYVREDVGGLLVGCFEPNPKPLPLANLPKDSSFLLLNEDWDHFEPMMRNAIHRVPALETAGARSLVNGPESFTLDSTPLLGESAEVRGFFTAAGMNSSGMVFGGGVGWAMAEWIVTGRAPLDLWATDTSRFTPVNNNLKALSKRIPEVLAKHFDIPWPGQDYESVRGVRRTPLHHLLQQRGASFTQRAGWERPAWFAPDGAPPEPVSSFGRQSWFPFWQAEHTAAREAVALFDQTPFAKLLVQGRDAERLLQVLCANDVAVAPGKVVYSAMLNDAGGFESDLTLTRTAEDAYLLVTGSQQGVRDAAWLRRHIADDQHVTVTDVTSGYAVIGLAGPRSRDLLSSISPASFANQDFPFATARQIEIGYGTAMAVRMSYAGELGWELHVAADLAVSVFESLMEAGAPLGLHLAGTNAMASLRIERGFRSWGHDIGPRDTPLEANLAFAVRLDKPGGFIGRDALLRQRDSGVSRRLLSFTFGDPDAFPHGHEPIYRDGRRCGALSSATHGHSLGRGVALGWIAGSDLDEAAVASGRFAVEIAQRRYTVQPHARAPVDPKGLRARL